MAHVRVIHWKANEAEALVRVLRAAQHTVDYREQVDLTVLRGVRDAPPEAIVIDLSRLPSRGREVATFLRGQKSTRRVPLVFVDGDAAKVERVRQVLPDALYVAAAQVCAAVSEALTKQTGSPIVPTQMMERYAGRSAARKLGIVAGASAAVIDPPRDYGSVIGPLPDGATLQEAPNGPCPVTLWFVRDSSSLLAALARMRRLATHTRLWVLWEKSVVGKHTGITQKFLREPGAAAGLVDYKICAVNGAWSGMLFARRKLV